MSTIHCIDLQHLGLEGAIASYLLDGPEPTLVDPGPTPSFERLRVELEGLGVGPRDLRHVLLTHVHLDHAGATGHLVDVFPEAVIHVHIDGAPHMADPVRLVASTRRTFGDAHDTLWGETRPVPAGRIEPWYPGGKGPWKGLRPLATPGHIAHHVAYLDEQDGTLLAGDSMGIVLAEGAPSHPPTPPPAVDVRAWQQTLMDIADVGPERFGAAHFGLHGNVPERIDALREGLTALEARVRTAVAAGDEDDAARYDDEVRDQQAPFVGSERTNRYFEMFSAATDWAGMRFYVQRNPR